MGFILLKSSRMTWAETYSTAVIEVLNGSEFVALLSPFSWLMSTENGLRRNFSVLNSAQTRPEDNTSLSISPPSLSLRRSDFHFVQTSAMAGRASSGLQVGGELVHRGFNTAADEFRNVILMLEVAGLSFVLEHPCKVLTADILEFFRNAKVRGEGSKIKSKVRRLPIRVKPSSLNRYLRLPAVDEEDSIEEEDTNRALAFCGLPRGCSSIKRKDMSPDGKLLSDIIGKVLICKTGSHDFLSRDMFKLLTAIICRKRISWGLILFERIKGCLLAPNFGRILSLYLNQLNGREFIMVVGVPIHHLKKIDASIFSRWERVITRATVQGAERDHGNMDVEPRNVPSTTQEPAETSSPAGEGEIAFQIASSVQGEPSNTHEDVVQEVQAKIQEDIQEEVKEEIQEELQKEVHEPVVATEVQGVINSESVIMSETVIEMVEEGQETQGAATAITEFFVDEPMEIFAAEGEPLVLPLQKEPYLLPPPAPAQLLLPWVRSDEEAHFSSFETNPGEFVHQERETTSAPDISLLKSIEAMFVKQKEHFDYSLKQVYEKVKKVERDVTVDITSIMHELREHTAKVNTWMVQGGKVIDHSITSIQFIHSKLANMTSENKLIIQTIDNFMTFVENQLRRYKEIILNSVSEEVKKGEISMLNKMDEISFDLKEKIQAVNAYIHDRLQWLHGEMFRTPQEQFPDPHFEGDNIFPHEEYHQIWSDPEEGATPAKDIPESSSRPAVKRRRYGEGPSAIRSDPSKGRDFAEGLTLKRSASSSVSPVQRFKKPSILALNTSATSHDR